jgi:hypothetical protein
MISTEEPRIVDRFDEVGAIAMPELFVFSSMVGDDRGLAPASADSTLDSPALTVGLRSSCQCRFTSTNRKPMSRRRFR